MLVTIGRDCRGRGAKAYMSAGELPEPGAIEHGVAADAELPAAPAEPPAGSPVERVVIRRWVQLVLLPLALLGLWELARASGTLFLVLVIACLVALILAPPVRILHQVMPRGLAILSVYLGLVAVVVGIGFLLVSPVSTQIRHFEHNLPELTRHANRDLTNLQTFLNKRGIKVHLTKQGQSALKTLQKDVLKRSGAIVDFSRGLLTQLVTIGFDLVLILVLSIYMLVYGRQIGRLVRRVMPPSDGTIEDDYPRLVQHAVSGYVRGQVIFSLVMGGSATLMLYIFGWLGIFPAGSTYAAFFGAFYGLMEFIPYVGPIIGPIPALLVALFENPLSAVWLLIGFIGLQQLEGHVVSPQVFGHALRINPIVIIVSLLIGDALYGIIGSLVALPVAAVIRQTILYLRDHTIFESWGPPHLPAIATSAGSDAPGRDPPKPEPEPEPKSS
jgi:predicted PurR-regulated permease PerM